MFIDKGMVWKAIVFISVVCSLTHAQTNPTAAQIGPALQILDTTKDQDGLVGSVRRVKTEYARINIKDGHPMEGPRHLLELTTYGVKGNRVDNVSYPIADSAVGREEYKYDNRGNIIEKILRDERGTILSREAYEYLFDKVGNWTKMTTSLVVIENGEFTREPTEVTYRTFTYYATDVEPLSSAATRSESNERTQPIGQPTKRVVKTAESAIDRPSTVATRSESSERARLASQPTEQIQKTEESVIDTSSMTNSPKTAEPQPLLVNASLNKPRTEKPGTETKSAFKSAVSERSEVVPTAEVVGATVDRSGDMSTKSTPTKSLEAADPQSTASRAAREETNKPDVSFSVTSVLPVDAIKKTESTDERQPAANTLDLGNAVSSATPNSSSGKKAFEMYEVGRRQFEAGDVKAAIGSYLESLRLEPASAEVQMNLGHAYLTTRKDRDAMKAFKEAVRLNPELAEGFYGLGFTSFRSKDYRGAMDGFKRAINLSPNMAKAHYGLALAYMELQKLDDMIHEYRILQRLDSKLAAKLAQSFPDIRRCEGTAYCR